MDDKEQQQEDLQLLAIGQVLFGDDLDAIRRTLLPGCEVKLSKKSARVPDMSLSEDVTWHLHCDFGSQEIQLASFQSRVFAYTTADCFVQSLSDAGLQKGALITGNARIRLLRRLSGMSAAGGK